MGTRAPRCCVNPAVPWSLLWAQAHPWRPHHRGVVLGCLQRSGDRAGWGHLPAAPWHSTTGGPVPMWTCVGACVSEGSRAVGWGRRGDGDGGKKSARGSAPPARPLQPPLRPAGTRRPAGGRARGVRVPPGARGREKKIEKKQQPPASPFL